jgi:hypothetical protein
MLLFSQKLQELVRLAKSDAEVLTRPVEITTPAHIQQSNPVQAGLAETVAHNSYHIGQIVVLRRCPKARPPRAVAILGDTQRDRTHEAAGGATTATSSRHGLTSFRTGDFQQSSLSLCGMNSDTCWAMPERQGHSSNVPTIGDPFGARTRTTFFSLVIGGGRSCETFYGSVRRRTHFSRNTS